jgi:hypothetical protein
MKLKTWCPRALLFSPLAFLCCVFMLFRRDLPGFTILDRVFAPTAVDMLGCTLVVFVMLLVSWTIFSKAVSSVLSVAYPRVLSRDFLTYLPLLSLALAPLAWRNYISSDDLAERMQFLVLAVGGSFVYLKIALVRPWVMDTPNPLRRGIERVAALSPGKKSLLLFIAALVVINTGSLVMTSEGALFSGDEPHFLLITHSLLHDGDFDLTDNYADRDYTRFMPDYAFIRPHLAPGVQTEGAYSFHSPGISFLMLPFYAAGSLFGKTGLALALRFGMSLFGALLGLQLFLFARRAWGREKTALALWAVFTFSAPVLFYSLHVYPEIVVALILLTVFRIYRFNPAPPMWQNLASGILLASLIWFHALKYAPLVGPFVLYILWNLLARRPRDYRAAVLVLAPFAVVGAAYFFFQYSLYGSFSPSAVSVTGVLSREESAAFVRGLIHDVPFRYRLDSLAGYFFDQRDGLLFYAPIYFFAFLGLVDLARTKAKDLRLLLFLCGPFVLNYAFMTQRAGYAPQARPLLPVIWALGILIGAFLANGGRRMFRLLFNGAAGIGFILAFLLLKNPLTQYQETTVGQTERGGGLFYLLSQTHFHLTDILPSFIKVEEWRWTPNFVWPGLLLLFVAAYVLFGKRDIRLKFAHHVALVLTANLVFFFWLVYYPRPLLLYPAPAAYPSGDKITFYALSRAGRMVEPGRFLLREADRAYMFYFTSWREIGEFEIVLGSEAGAYNVGLTAFDHVFFEDKVENEIRTVSLPSPPVYNWKNAHLYRITIQLDRISDVATAENPFLFSIRSVRTRPAQ